MLFLTVICILFNRKYNRSPGYAPISKLYCVFKNIYFHSAFLVLSFKYLTYDSTQWTRSPRTSCTRDLLHQGHLVPGTCCTRDILYKGYREPGTSCTWNILYQGHLVPGTSCTRDILYQGQLLPGTSRTRDILYQGQNKYSNISA